MHLQKQCVLQTRRCSLKGLLGQRRDNSATACIVERFSTEAKSVAGTKFLINRKHSEVKELVAAAQAYRQAGYQYSFQWGDTKGLRLVPCKAVPDCEAETAVADKRFWNGVDAYAYIYPQLVKEAEQISTGLGHLFDLNDYPAQSRIRGMFEAKTEYMPVPDSSHFVADLTESMINDAKAEMVRTNNIRANEAVNDILTRVENGVGEYLERLSRYKIKDDKVERTFRDSIVSNVSALAELVRKLNFADNAGLNNLAEQISRLARFSAVRLRDDKQARDGMIGEGKALVAKLDSLRKIDTEVDNLIGSVGEYYT